MENERLMDVTDENGNVVKMYILFTTKLEEDGKNYVFYTKADDNDGNVFVSSFEESGELNPVTDDEEWSKLEEAFNSYMEDSKKAASQNGGCQGCNGGNCGHEGECNTDSCDCQGGGCCQNN